MRTSVSSRPYEGSIEVLCDLRSQKIKVYIDNLRGWGSAVGGPGDFLYAFDGARPIQAKWQREIMGYTGIEVFMASDNEASKIVRNMITKNTLKFNLPWQNRLIETNLNAHKTDVAKVIDACS